MRRTKDKSNLGQRRQAIAAAIVSAGKHSNHLDGDTGIFPGSVPGNTRSRWYRLSLAVDALMMPNERADTSSKQALVAKDIISIVQGITTAQTVMIIANQAHRFPNAEKAI
jgi:hypothetical protein